MNVPIPKPFRTVDISGRDCNLYTAEQLRAYGDAREAAGRRAALEEAARLCESVNNYDNFMTATDCADAIRAMAKEIPYG